MDKITKALRSVERQMLHINLADRKRNACIRNKTKVRADRREEAKLKWKFARHNIKQIQDQWNKCIINSRPERKTRWMNIQQHKKKSGGDWGRPMSNDEPKTAKQIDKQT